MVDRGLLVKKIDGKLLIFQKIQLHNKVGGQNNRIFRQFAGLKETYPHQYLTRTISRGEVLSVVYHKVP